MRIAISNPRRDWGGASTVAAGLARGLQRRGHEVVVLCRPDSPLHRELEDEVATAPVLEGVDFSPRALWRCARVLRRHGAQVLLSATAKDLRLSVPAARLLGIPVVVRMLAEAPLRDRLQDRVFYHWLPEQLVANSAATRAMVLGSVPWLGPGDVSLIHNGVPLERVASAPPPDLEVPADAFVVGFVGRLVAEKGLPDLAAAWERVAAELPNALLLIAGQGDEEEALRRRFRGLPGVRWLGFRDDVPALLYALDLLVLPSHSEAFGLAAAEAMNAGTPVVATRVGGLPELIGEDGGCLVPPHAPQQLATAILQLAADPARRARLARAARERVRERFSEERAVDDYETLLQRVARAAAPSREDE